MTAGSTGSTPSDWAGGPSIKISEKLLSPVYASNQQSIKLTNPQNLHSVERVFETKKCAKKN